MSLAADTNLGADTFIQRSHWRAMSDDPDVLTLVESKKGLVLCCHLLGVILPHNFCMEPHGDFMASKEDSLLALTDLSFTVGPPSSLCAHKYGEPIVHRFWNGIDNARLLSAFADDDVHGSGTGVQYRDGIPNYDFHLPIFEQRVGVYSY